MRTLSLLYLALLAPIAARAEPLAPTKGHTPTPHTPTPHTGEIALDGTIESLDVVKSTLTLRATSFMVPSGVTKTLKIPKIKRIQLSNGTQYLENTGIANPSLGDLQKGLNMRVVGLEQENKPFLARVVAWNAPPLAVALDPDTPTNIANLLPAAQRRGEISLRVIDAGFALKKRKVSLPAPPDFDLRPTFFFSYRLDGPKISETNEHGAKRTLEDFVTLKRLIGPQGQVLTQFGAGTLGWDDSGKGQKIFVNALDPSWKNLVAQWEILDPQAPPSARGIITSSLTFDNLPVPGALGKSLPVNRTLTTACGTQITLEKVAGEQVAARLATNFHFHWNTPPTVSDLNLSLSIGKVESDGKKWESHSGGGSAQGKIVSYRVDTLGPVGAQEMAVTLKVREEAPSLQERKWFSLSEMTIPIAEILDKVPAGVEPLASDNARWVLSETKTPTVRVQAEFRDNSWNTGWGGWLWIKSEDLAPEESWLVREVKGSDEKGQNLNAWMFPIGKPHQFWRADGTRNNPDEYGQPIVAIGKEKPALINLRLKLEKARRLERWSHFQGLPFPAPGRAVEVKTGQIEDDFISVRRIFSFQNPSELPGIGTRREGFQHQQGLAIVVEISPLFVTADVQLQALTATDASGRELGQPSYLPVWNGNLMREGAENAFFRTIVLPVPAADAKRLDLRLSMVETAWSGQTQNVELKEIAVK